ncbi:hypothetical protein BC827DRAFT_1126222 [Russula dissimulans]|nr:hypothetical protein BC827DRAFT_1126222 [Russula dissimulans]
MADIEIFLVSREAQVPFKFISIPRSDIERLAVLPFRWIRYVVFAVSGARGDLSTTPRGPPVDYDRTDFADDENTYYYWPSEDYAFVDYKGLNDRVTSTVHTARGSSFRESILRRDGRACVVTQAEKEDCDAVHLIPRSKGDDYIAKVLQLRFPRDNSAPLSDVGIDNIVNGMLLAKTLHSQLGRGVLAFIKTPNYGLRPEDIRKFPRGSSRPDYITLHWLKKPQDYNPTLLATLQNGGIGPATALALGANVDALFQGEGGSLPSTVILDYAYGVAAYQTWRSERGDVSDAIRAYREAHYEKIPHLRRDSSLGDTSDSPEPDDSADLEYEPPRSRKRRRSSTSRRDESDLGKAMDELNMALMYIQGITPEMAAERREKEIEQEERAAQEASRSKVMEWKNHLDVY